MSKYVAISGTSNSGKTQSLIEIMSTKLKQGKSCLYVCGEERPISILGRLSKLIEISNLDDEILKFAESEKDIFGTVAYDCVFIDTNKDPEKNIAADNSTCYYSKTLLRKR